jgi:membrane protease YdiL (CAAX protease family)
MENTPPNAEKFFKSACYFESSLILVAFVLGWVAGIYPFEYFFYSENAVILGVLATLPMFIFFIALDQLSVPSIREVRHILLEHLGPALNRYDWADLFVLAAIAGIAEETLFRGVLQPWLENAWGLWAGLILSNLIFGLVHAVTPLYALLAALVGMYLGLFLDYGGERNLLVPMMIHGFYDFLAFLWVRRHFRLQQHNASLD